MTYGEIKSAIAEEIGDTPSDAWLKRKINEGYEKIISSIKDIDPGSYRKRSDPFVLNFDGSYEVSVDLPSDCETIDMINFIENEGERPIKIKDTTYDEISPVLGFRWYREGAKVYFRGIDRGYSDVVVHYIKSVPDLASNGNIPDFSSKYHSILVYYAVGRYYQDENAETDWKLWIQEFERGLGDFIRTIRPKKERERLKVFFNDGERSGHC